MADPRTETRDPETRAESTTPSSGIRLSKEQRKALMAQIERQLSRTESPERILQRAEQALAAGKIDQARQLEQHLLSAAPATAGLAALRERIAKVENEEKHKANLRQTEEMLTRYIQQRKKPLAALALQTLVELVPDHPRRREYEIWVADLDQEVAMQRQIDERFAAGRAALRTGDIAAAQRHLETLRKLDPHAKATDELAAEVQDAEHEEETSADIERLKREVGELLAREQLDEAERGVERLAQRDVPKVTVDFFRKRLAEARGRARDRADAAALTALFDEQVAARDWQGAREVAHRFGERFPDRPDAARFFNMVTEMEAAERRKQSLDQGLATLERFIAGGQRPEAEVALKLLERLVFDKEQLAQLKARVARL